MKQHLNRELIIIKLILDFSTNYLKEYDGPYFKRYKTYLIKAAVKFYKMLYKNDQESESEEGRLTKHIKKNLSKSLGKLKVSSGQLREIKSQMYLSESSKQMAKFYLKELKVYKDDVPMLEDKSIFA